MSKQSLTFLTPTYVEKQIGERTIRFYPISTKVAFELRALGKPLARAFSTLFAGVGRESTHIEKVQRVGDDYSRETINSAIDPKLAEAKLAARDKVIDDLVNVFLDPANGAVVARVIMDSMRDEVTRTPTGPTKEQVTEFLQTDVQLMKELLVGVAEANKDVFGPFVSQLKDAVRAVDSQGKSAETVPDESLASRPAETPATLPSEKLAQ